MGQAEAEDMGEEGRSGKGGTVQRGAKGGGWREGRGGKGGRQQSRARLGFDCVSLH